MMELKKEIHKYIQNYKSDIIDALKKLVKIPSVKGEALPSAPFGIECAKILEFVKDLYENNGFETELDQKGGYLLSYYGKGKKTLGLFAHADVVPVSDDWVYTKPFEPVEKDGFLIGRGVLDDKSAVVISLYCAKIIKELNIPFNSKLVLFTGANEESGMKDVENYVKKHTPPDFSMVCDTAFPLYRGCKSMMSFWVTVNTPLCDVEDFHGGTSSNITLGEVSAWVNGELMTATGKSCHGALPEGSLNAGYLLAKRLSTRLDICESDRKQTEFVAKILERYYGEIYVIAHTDPDFGRLTCTNGIIKTENGRLALCFDMRFGLSADKEKIRSRINDFFDANNCTVNFFDEKKGYITPKDNKYVKSCLKAYSAFTGNNNPGVYLNAGGTYGRMLPCAVETGTQIWAKPPFPLPEGHGGAHQSDECISIDGLINALELTLLMLLECDKTGDARQ